jgi:hypothetical protein
VIKAPVRAPRARAHAERWVGSARRECLDRLLILGRRHLELVVKTYALHYKSGSRFKNTAASPFSPGSIACKSILPANDSVCAKRNSAASNWSFSTGDACLCQRKASNRSGLPNPASTG